MPRGDWSLEVCDRHLCYGTWLICTCDDLWSLAEMTVYSEETCKTLTQNCLEEFIKGKKSDQGAQAFFVEDYVHDIFFNLSHFTKLNLVLWKEQICQGLNADKIQIFYDKNHEVPWLVKSDLNTHNSIKYEVVSKYQITLSNMKYKLNNTCVQSWT